MLLITQEPSELIVENNINETAAALGVSANFATGDAGDDKASDKVITVNMPASSPYASCHWWHQHFPQQGLHAEHTDWMGHQPDTHRQLFHRLRFAHVRPCPDQPKFLGFDGGAGGGTSAYFAKPSYQTKLSGNFRLVPDIAYLADPWTGAEFVYTEGGQQSLGVVGGTSLATPMFSGLWAIATQAAGKWIGQASPLLYTLPSGSITDVRPGCRSQQRQWDHRQPATSSNLLLSHGAGASDRDHSPVHEPAIPRRH